MSAQAQSWDASRAWRPLLHLLLAMALQPSDALVTNSDGLQLTSFLLLVATHFVTSSVLVTSSKARRY